MATTNLILPIMEAAQAQKHVTFNEAMRSLDAVVQISVKDRNLTAPPGSPADGDRYLVATGATGLWAGWDGDIAAWIDGAWMRFIVRPGWVVFVEDEGRALIRSTSAFVELFTGAQLLGTVSQVGGVPTGAVIEKGSNAQGSYVRFADGTQICWNTLTGQGPVDTALGSIFRSGTVATGNFPIAFAAVPTVQFTKGKATGLTDGWVSANQQPTATAWGNCTLFAGATRSDTDFWVHCFAIGRWFT